MRAYVSCLCHVCAVYTHLQSRSFCLVLPLLRRDVKPVSKQLCGSGVCVCTTYTDACCYSVSPVSICIRRGRSCKQWHVVCCCSSCVSRTFDVCFGLSFVLSLPHMYLVPCIAARLCDRKPYLSLHVRTTHND